MIDRFELGTSRVRRAETRGVPRRRLASLLITAALVGSGAVRLGAQEASTPVPLAPHVAAESMIVPEGFHVTLFAGEPDVQQPIGFCIDDRGRLWVAEAYNYPRHGTTPGDRIVILEDADGDGRFDQRTVFYDGLNYVTGIELGFGGAWVMSPPYFYFIPDRDGDDRPDAEPTLLMDGFGNHANPHNLANALDWGPDGWLYGTHGRTNWSLPGKPGTPQNERRQFDGGVYRYHPLKHVFEPFADGTVNPWGIDWDDYGQGFVCNCVEPHLYHVIQGAHYEPWRNRESSRHAYQRIATIADHRHYSGTVSVTSALGTPEEDAAGGGHAHCGTLIYLGDNWPDRYRNTVLMNNIHGHRINHDLLERAGSGYVARHGADLLRSQDPWYMGVALHTGPDGSVFVCDWSDTGECHSYTNTQRGTGRIYKISYGQPEVVKTDLARLSDMELVALHAHRNDWFVRHARRNLQERAANGHEMGEVVNELHALLARDPAEDRQLRLIWTLHALGAADQDFLLGLLRAKSEHVRAWGIRLLTDDPAMLPSALEPFANMAASDPSALVALHLASALQKLPFDNRWQVAASLAERAEFEQDANLPLMIWYGIEPLVHVNLERFVELLERSQLSIVRRHIARRVASLSDSSKGLDVLTECLGRLASPPARRDLLTGVLQGLEGVRGAPMPAGWREAFARLQVSGVRDSRDEGLRDLGERLALIFDDPVVLASLRSRATNRELSAEIRNRAILALVAKKADGFDEALLVLVQQEATRREALRGLGAYHHAETASVILAAYDSFDPLARQDALQTLASRAAWANALLAAVESASIPRADLTAFTVRQLRNLGDDHITKRVESLWGQVRETSAERAKLMAEYKSQLTPGVLQRASRAAGRTVFEAKCANCHKLFDAGGAIGPDLTGAQRTNLDYLLENLLDPSAAISRDFQMQILETDEGRVVTGLVVAESEKAITIQTPTEKIVIPVAEIESRATSKVSMMPDGVLQELPVDKLADLIAYLQGPSQVPRVPDTSR